MKGASQKVIVACAVAALALACRSAGTPTAQRRAVDSSPVVARVDDAVITVSDVQERINKQPPFVRARYADAAKKRELVDELVQHEAIAAEAARRGYAEDPDVQRAVKKMISRMLKLDFESKLKIEDVPDADVEKYYKEHRGRLSSEGRGGGERHLRQGQEEGRSRLRRRAGVAQGSGEPRGATGAVPGAGGEVLG